MCALLQQIKKKLIFAKFNYFNEFKMSQTHGFNSLNFFLLHKTFWHFVFEHHDSRREYDLICGVLCIRVVLVGHLLVTVSLLFMICVVFLLFHKRFLFLNGIQKENFFFFQMLPFVVMLYFNGKCYFHYKHLNIVNIMIRFEMCLNFVIAGQTICSKIWIFFIADDFFIWCKVYFL